MRTSRAMTWLALLLVGCGGGGGGPTGPTAATLALTVSPSVIGLIGVAEITVQARNSDGSAMVGGAIGLEASLGTLETSLLSTGIDGRAVTRLRGDGRAGASTVRARIGASGPTAEATVRIGNAGLSLQAVPVAIAIDGRATIIAVLSDGSGHPVGAGVVVSLSTNLGRLENPAPLTDAAGQAITVLVAPGVGGEATVRAAAQGSAAELAVPIGRGLDLTLRAAPTAIAIDGAATVTLLALLPDGHPVAIGTDVLFSTTLGALDVSRIPIAETALATTVLRGTGVKGTARVTAQVVGFAETTTIEVPIG